MALGILNTYLVDAEQRFDEAAKSERWYVTCAIPDVDWPANWSIVPDRGDAPPAGAAAFPAALAVDGTCLKRTINFTERPGFVLVRLTYGYDISILANNKAVVTGRTILVKQKIEYAYSGNTNPPTGKTIVSGTKYAANGLPIGGFYDITPGQGYDRFVEMPFQQFRLTAILDATGLQTYIRPLIALTGGLNSAQWSLLGGVNNIAINQAMYRGCTWSLYRNTPGSTRLYRADLDFLVHWYKWQRSLKRTEYETAALEVPLIDAAGNTTGAGRQKGKVVAAAGHDATLYYYRGSYDFATLLNPLL